MSEKRAPVTYQRPDPKFKVGDAVFKHTGDYGGPGIVRGVTVLPGGRLRYLVGHTIEGGYGEFLHVYSQGNLREQGVDASLGLRADE